MADPVVLNLAATDPSTYVSSATRIQTLDFEVPVGTDALLIVVTHRFNATLTVYWDGDASPEMVAQMVGDQIGGTGAQNAKIYWLPDPAPGSGVITVDTNGVNCWAVRIVAYAVANVDAQVAPEEVLSTFGAGFNDIGGNNFFTPQYDNSLFIAAYCTAADELEPITGLQPGWSLDAVAGAYHSNSAATSGMAAFHKIGSTGGVQENFTMIRNEGGAAGIVIVEVKNDPTSGGPTSVLLDPTALTISGAPLGINAKTQLALSPSILTLSGQELTAKLTQIVELAAASLGITGRPLVVNAKEFLELTAASVPINGAVLVVQTGQTVTLLPAELALQGQWMYADNPSDIFIIAFIP